MARRMGSVPKVDRMGSITVAALYVQADGAYFGLEGIDPWDEARDARKYDGPHPVIAHPPCARWCQLAPLNQSLGRFTLGDDGGMFAAALAAVRKFGGVLEHPARTYAWQAYGLVKPPRAGGWVRTLHDEGWSCEVEQGHYGCPAPKPTWLYAYGCDLPSFKWGASGVVGARISNLRTTGKNIPKTTIRGGVRTDGRKSASATPPEFRDILLAMARSAAK